MSALDTFDLAIVGAGFGGSLLAMIARRLGLSVLLLERGTHPRFAIGESTSPLANLLIEELARRYDLPRLLPLTTYGAWLKTYPEIRRGLKRGFSFYAHQAGEPFRGRPDRSNELLVAASPRDEIADTHWLRADVDHFLVREAVSLGVDYRDNVALDAAQWDSAPFSTTLTGTADGSPLAARCRLRIDATGPRGYLSRSGVEESRFAVSIGEQALYTHFTDVARVADIAEYQTPGAPPYPPDAAALHHVFDGGWMWVLRFDDGVTSAGVALQGELANELRLSEGEPAWHRLLSRFPTIGAQFADARPIRPFSYSPCLPYRAARASGPGWAMLPSAAAFIDPLFSTGFPLTLLGVERLAEVLGLCWSDPPLLERRLSEYGEATLADADATASYLALCYPTMRDFPRFVEASMIYFASASYSEMARRLRRRHLVPGFLLRENAGVSAAIRSHQAIADAIEPFNIAGLADPGRRNWYPVDLEDVVRGAEKLRMTPEQMRDEFARADWV